MKKQVNSLGNGSLYGMIAVFILSLMFGTLESQAINKPSASKVSVAVFFVCNFYLTEVR